MVAGGLRRRLQARAQAGRSLRIGVIGAGKFATMFLSQALRLPGLHVLGVADLSLERAREALRLAGWPRERTAAGGFAEALEWGSTCLTESGEELIAAEGLELVIEATGVPAAGIRHALMAFDRGLHVVMVNVEADALAGPLLAERAAAAGVVYSLAYGDQPALICELVDWARACGFDPVSAGKGSKYLPEYHRSTPETVWDYYGFSQETVARGDFNPRMFNSFLDGTKSAIEMAAVANATGLTPQPDGLRFPPAGADKLARVCRPEAEGGRLAHKGTVEVVSSLERDGRVVANDLRWGVFVTFEAASDYVARCFAEYGLVTDETGRYTAMYRPYHLIGLELAVSVLRAGLLGEATGSPTAFRGDVVATAKRDLRVGETLDGEGGYCVYGRLLPAAASLRAGALPIGLAHGIELTQDVKAGETLRWSDVALGLDDPTVRFRKEMEARFARFKV
ncbi:MAG: SAF domain-containing protein [Deinococcota bacterium]|nr:SAF domain-containing protein [Deinococcota bacterium]